MIDECVILCSAKLNSVRFIPFSLISYQIDVDDGLQSFIDSFHGTRLGEVWADRRLPYSVDGESCIEIGHYWVNSFIGFINVEYSPFEFHIGVSTWPSCHLPKLVGIPRIIGSQFTDSGESIWKLVSWRNARVDARNQGSGTLLFAPLRCMNRM